MDPENVKKEAVFRVTDWLRGIWEMKRRGGPSVQQWIDSIPSPTKSTVDDETSQSTSEHLKKKLYSNNPIMTVSASPSITNSPTITMTSIQSTPSHSRLARDPSLQSDSSHCSSVESLLELRRPDPEAILLGLGFGGCTHTSHDNGPLSRIPKRFLQPSKLKGIAINDFVKQQQETSESIDSTSLGYRGLTGSPFVAPSEIVQKIMERLREHESHEVDAYTAYNSEPYSPLLMQEGRLSVLSPDSRQFVQRQRSKSPDMRNKRMIIGQKSFAFGCDGDLIEINQDNPLDHEHSFRRTSKFNSSEYQHNDVNSFTTSDQFDLGLNYLKMSMIRRASTNRDSGTPEIDTMSESDSSPKQQEYPVRENLEEDNIEDTNNNSSIAETDSEKIGKLLKTSRRASDSLCEINPISMKIHHNEERRFSDSIIKAKLYDQSIDLRKRQRKSLKRQARISDEEAAEYCDSAVSSDPNTPSSSSKNRVFELDSRQTLCDPRKQHLCCKNEDLGQICEHEEGSKDCCYHASNTSCWKKMRKIIQKNQKLENMVVKSRQEMAEIREMLSNVLSIRMEPGF